MKDINGEKLAKESDPKSQDTELSRLVRVLTDFSGPTRSSGQMVALEKKRGK